MKTRYLEEGKSCWYCDFEGEDNLRAHILEKFEDVWGSLDEYLFEFVRPYLEGLMRPSFEEFLESGECAKMSS